VTELEHQKELLKTKIDAHRTILGLELRATRLAFDPLGATLSLLGVDRSVVEILVPVMRAAMTHLSEYSGAEQRSEEADS